MRGNGIRWLSLGLAWVLPLGASLVTAADDDKTAAPAGSREEVNLAELLSQASGVRVATMCTNCNVANVTMLGQTGSHVQIWRDGLPVVGGLGGIYLLSVLPSEGIASTEVIRGAGTVLSGSEAAVGAVVLHTLDPSTRKTPLIMAAIDDGSLDWRSQQFMAFGREGRFAGGFTFTHAQSGPSDPNHDGNFDLGALDRTTFGGTGVYSFSKRSHLRVDALTHLEAQRGNKGAFGATGATLFHKEDIDIRRNEGSAAWDVELDDGSKLTISGRQSNRNQETSDDYPAVQQPYMTVKETSTAGEARYERTLWDRHLLTGGVTARRLLVDGRSDHGQEVARTDTVRQQAAFAQIDLALPARLDVVAGVRWDDYNWSGTGGLQVPGATPTTGRSMFLPRVRIGWKATKTLGLSLTGGKALAAPTPIFERVCCGQNVLPNDYARAEFSTNYLFDADYVPWRWLKLRGSIFRNDYSDYQQKLIIFSFDFIPTMGLVNYSPFTLRGAEIEFEMRFQERFSFGAQATSVRKVGNDPIKVGAVGDTLFELPGDQPVPFIPEKQGAVFVKWDDSRIGLRASLQAQYTGSIVIQQMREGFGFGDLFTTTPSFWVLNFRGEKRLGERFSLFAGVDNISNFYQTNLSDPRYDYQWGPLRGRYYYGGLSWKL